MKTIVICGAGIAGIAAAYYLSKSNIKRNIILVDKNQPLSFTTSKSGENFRDYWPQKCMRDLSSHSILLMKELRNEYASDVFKMNFSGYNFISCNDEPIFSTSIDDGKDLFMQELSDPKTIVKNYPYLSPEIKRVITLKNAGNIDVYALGSLLLRVAKMNGVSETKGEIINITKVKSQNEVVLDTGQKINADQIVIAAGPFINHIAKMIGFEFPIQYTLQRKFIIPDPKKIIPREMPFTIYSDRQFLNWSSDENAFFESEEKYQWLLKEFPGGLHIKPEGEGIKMGWAFNSENENPLWQNPTSEFFPQVVLKGASQFIPQLSEYENEIPTPIIEYAGYYTRTKENWPLIGPTDDPNVFVIGALSGFGTMTACAAGKLCSNYITEENELSDYAPYFHPNRYQNEGLVQEIITCVSDGQL